ncbi:MAG: MarR family transcriptional regulator [Candidatus Omnitrophota bacterium]
MSVSLFEFGDKINEILPLFQREFARQLTKEFFKSRITLPQFLILMILDKEGELKMSSLARLMNVSMAAMTGSVSRLVASGFVLRRDDPKDRRIVRIQLTSKGSQLVDKLKKQRREMIIHLFKDISGEDRTNYLRILTLIKDKLIAQVELPLEK